MKSRYPKDGTGYASPVRIMFVFTTQVPAIQQKRTVAFLNQFVVHTVQFLNRFSAVCEEVGPWLLLHGKTERDFIYTCIIHIYVIYYMYSNVHLA